jgi:uncharacterized protein YegL
MKYDFTDITVVLDRSGSMSAVANDTIGGFNQFIKEQKSVKGKANLTLMQFDTEYELVHNGKDIKEVPSLEFSPRGGTALFDAVGRSITETGTRLRRMSDKDRPAKVIFVIITDGEENSSKEYTREKVKGMITHQQEKYNWSFVFLGANIDAIQAAGYMGISGYNAMNYAPTGVGMAAAFGTTSSNMASYRCGTSADMSYSDEDRKKAMEK